MTKAQARKRIEKAIKEEIEFLKSLKYGFKRNNVFSGQMPRQLFTVILGVGDSASYTVRELANRRQQRAYILRPVWARLNQSSRYHLYDRVDNLGNAMPSCLNPAAVTSATSRTVSNIASQANSSYDFTSGTVVEYIFRCERRLCCLRCLANEGLYRTTGQVEPINAPLQYASQTQE